MVKYHLLKLFSHVYFLWTLFSCLLFMAPLKCSIFSKAVYEPFNTILKMLAFSSAHLQTFSPHLNPLVLLLDVAMYCNGRFSVPPWCAKGKHASGGIKSSVTTMTTSEREAILCYKLHCEAFVELWKLLSLGQNQPSLGTRHMSDSTAFCLDTASFTHHFITLTL